MEAIAIAASAFVGLLIGSFLNVIAYRVPLGLSVIRPPSACPGCGHEIRGRDNIPVLSWILLRRKCRDCGMPISARYPLVEAGTATLFGVTAAVIGPEWVLAAYLWFIAVTLALILTDLDHHRIPNRILYPGTVVALVLLAAGTALDGGWAGFGRALAGGAAYFAFFLLLALVARGGFGFGDVKLAFLLGVFAAHRSWDSLIVAGFMAFVIGGLVAIILLILRRAGRRDMIPFGPALVIGAWIGSAAGTSIASWYLG